MVILWCFLLFSVVFKRFGIFFVPYECCLFCNVLGECGSVHALYVVVQALCERCVVSYLLFEACIFWALVRCNV